MAGTPKLTPKQWADIRQIWEKDPREGYAWVIEALELSVSKVAVRKRAISEGWQKDDPQAEIVQAAILADRRAEKREAEKERAAGQPKVSRKVSAEQGFHAETIKKPRKKTVKPNGDNDLAQGVGDGAAETFDALGNLGTESGNLGNHRAETLGDDGNHDRKQSTHLHRGVNGGESDMPEQGGNPDASASVSDDPSMDDGFSGESWEGERDGVDIDDLEVSDCRDVSADGPSKFGSTSGYRDEYAGQARRLCMLLNATDDQLCGFFEIGKSTLYTWRKENPAFLHAIKEGRLGADARVAESLYRRAVGMAIPKTVVTSFQGGVTLTDIHEYLPPDVGAARLWLNNRQPDHWKDNPEPPPPDPKSMYPKPEELDVIYDQSVTLSRKRADVALNRMERLGLMGSMTDVASDMEDVEEKPRDGR